MSNDETDIVDRLMTIDGKHCCDNDHLFDGALVDAADEINRLRSDVKRLQELNEHYRHNRVFFDREYGYGHDQPSKRASMVTFGMVVRFDAQFLRDMGLPKAKRFVAKKTARACGTFEGAVERAWDEVLGVAWTVDRFEEENAARSGTPSGVQDPSEGAIE